MEGSDGGALGREREVKLGGLVSLGGWVPPSVFERPRSTIAGGGGEDAMLLPMGKNHWEGGGGGGAVVAKMLLLVGGEGALSAPGIIPKVGVEVGVEVGGVKGA